MEPNSCEHCQRESHYEVVTRGRVESLCDDCYEDLQKGLYLQHRYDDSQDDMRKNGTSYGRF